MQLNCGLSKVQIMFFYLNLRLSCERYRKNNGHRMNKNTVMNGYQVNLPYGGTLPYAVSKTYHLYQCRYNLCLVYKHVVDKPRGCMFVMPMQRL